MLALCHCVTSSNISDQHDLLKELCHVSYSCIFPIIVVFAAVANIINAMVLFRPHATGRPHPTPTRTYLLWLALSHCIICTIVGIGLTIKPRFGINYTLAFYLAHLEEPLYNIFNCSCAFIIVGLSTDRYQAACHPHSYTVASGHRRAPYKVALAYLISLLIYIPMGFSQEVTYSDYYHGWYITKGTIFGSIVWMVWSVISQILHRIIPCVLLLILNVQILRAVAQLKNSRTVMLTRRAGAGRRREQQIIHLLTALTVSFMLSNIPAAVLQLIYVTQTQHCYVTVAVEVARTVSNCLEMAGYFCDFFLYFLMNPEYRHDLHSLTYVKCCCDAPLCSVPDSMGDQPPTLSPSH